MLPQRRLLRALHLSFGLALVLCACDTRPRQSKPRPPGFASNVPEAAPQAPPAKAEQAPVASPLTAAAPVAQEEPKKEEKKKRDFSAELLQMVGSSAVSCLNARPSDGALRGIDVSLSALVSVTGRVSRGEASSAVLVENELACIRARVESVTFMSPIEPPPPFTVQATLHFDRAPESPAAKPSAPAPTATPPANAEAPTAPTY